MKHTWTVAKLVRNYPQCTKMLKDYELKYSDVNSLTIKELAAELEEDPDDFMSELDDMANSLSEYDAEYAGVEYATADDDLDDDLDNDDEYDKGDEGGEDDEDDEDGEDGEDGVILDDEETDKDPILGDELDDDDLDDDDMDDDDMDDDDMDDNEDF